MEKEEQIKNLLLELKNDYNKMLELEKYDINVVIKVALKNGLYEPLMIIFKPVTINGEVRICFDAFSTNILKILSNSYETKEQAEQAAKKEYENNQNWNSTLGEDSIYESKTYEDILNSKIIIPKEIKEAFRKELFTIDYEQISKMKIKNCHARAISGVGNPIETLEDVIFYSELPCLIASIDLFNKNITTTMNDTEGVIEDGTISNGTCKIWFSYDVLSQENKDIVEELIASGNAEKFTHSGVETISIFVPCSGEETVEEISDKLMTIISKLKAQDIKYGFGTMEEIYQRYAPALQRYPFFAKGLFSNGINLSDLIKLGKKMGEILYYDEEEGLIWTSYELYKRHKRYVEAQPAKNALQKPVTNK